MEARLAATNQRFRYQRPVGALRRQAERAWSVDIDVLLWGHFHAAWQYAVGDKLAMVVPAWLETTLSLAVADNGRWQLVDRDLAPATPDAGTTTFPTIEKRGMR
jgi:hypothetical protein